MLPNPAQFILDSKTSLAALQLPKLRQRIAEKHSVALAILDRCLPETSLLTPDRASYILADKDDWVVKFAGYDRGQQTGGRSWQIGAQPTRANWPTTIRAYLGFGWPVVAQWMVPSAPVDIAYFGAADQPQWLYKGTTRLCVLLLCNHTQVTTAGVHVTVSGSNRRSARTGELCGLAHFGIKRGYFYRKALP